MVVVVVVVTVCYCVAWLTVHLKVSGIYCKSPFCIATVLLDNSQRDNNGRSVIDVFFETVRELDFKKVLNSLGMVAGTAIWSVIAQ